MINEAAPEAARATTWPEAMPVWLLERLEQLGLRFPTPIQSAALRAPADAVLRTLLVVELRVRLLAHHGGLKPATCRLAGRPRPPSSPRRGECGCQTPAAAAQR